MDSTEEIHPLPVPNGESCSDTDSNSEQVSNDTQTASSELVDQPHEVVDQPLEVATQPVQVADQAEEVTAQPLQVPDETIEVTEQPLEMVDHPLEDAAQPVKVPDQIIESVVSEMVLSETALSEPECVSETVSSEPEAKFDTVSLTEEQDQSPGDSSLFELGRNEPFENDPLSIANENQREMELIVEISTLQHELKTAQLKMSDLQQNIEQLNASKSIADSFMKISNGVHDPISWLRQLKNDETDRIQKETIKSSEFLKKIQNLERERNDSVVKNAMLQKSALDANKKAEDSIKEAKKEKFLADKMKVEADRFRKTAAIATREHGTMKEQYGSNLNILKWTQAKLKSESDTLENEKEKNGRLIREVKEAKEETAQIRTNTQQIISTYQNSEEVRSNALDGELRTLKIRHEELLVESNRVKSDLSLTEQDLIKYRGKCEDAEAKILALLSQVACQEDEKDQLRQERDTMAQTLNRQKDDLTELGSKYATAQKLLDETALERDQIQEDLTGAKERAEDRHQQAAELKERESDLLSSVQGLSQGNSELRQQVETLTQQCETFALGQAEFEQCRTRLETASAALEELKSSSSATVDSLMSELQGVKKQLENSANRTRALEKQNVSIKKELRQALKRTDESSSMPRSHSGQSLDSIGRGADQTSASSPNVSRHTSPKHSRPSKSSFTDDYGMSSIDKNEIIHKLVDTQRLNVKRNEKIDFLNDHVSQLTDELKKKTKLIQSYMVREQHGRMKPPGKEQEVVNRVNKLLNGIQVQTPDNLDVVLEVNQKLQLVLEDTLLKNMMQQDNIKMLGEEIDRQHSTCRCKPNRR